MILGSMVVDPGGEGVGACAIELASAVVGVTVVYVVAVEVCKNVEYTVWVTTGADVACLRTSFSCSTTGIGDAWGESKLSSSKAQPTRSMTAENHERIVENQRQSRENQQHSRESKDRARKRRNHQGCTALERAWVLPRDESESKRGIMHPKSICISTTYHTLPGLTDGESGRLTLQEPTDNKTRGRRDLGSSRHCSPASPRM